jgi:hypothetical protein
MWRRRRSRRRPGRSFASRARIWAQKCLIQLVVDPVSVPGMLVRLARTSRAVHTMRGFGQRSLALGHLSCPAAFRVLRGCKSCMFGSPIILYVPYSKIQTTLPNLLFDLNLVIQFSTFVAIVVEYPNIFNTFLSHTTSISLIRSCQHKTSLRITEQSSEQMSKIFWQRLTMVLRGAR